ncbi:MAG: discoidin domain-containing protein, partial [Planctomycetota bacterium]|nr:discoidin domain-containing protein [Planctomycetota bacterium]
NPQRALDGNTDGQWGGGSVTHTNGAPSWWEVDLRDTYEIWSITIWNRLDCCSERLTDFTVTVLDSDSNVVFEEVGLDALSQESFELPEIDAEGQFVRISMPAAFLSLAEVEIFSPTDGLPPPPPPPPPLEPLEEGVNPNGWIRSNGWNMLFLDQDGGCGGGGFPRMEGNWVAPYDLAEENPRPGDEWEIDFLAAESRGWTGGNVSDVPTWISMNFLRANAIPLIPEDLVNFDVMATQARFTSPDNIVAISTTYVENTTDEPMRVYVCSASDDSIRVDINNHNVTLISACRGSAANCQEVTCADLAPGINKITTYVWDGGGGWNMRVGLRDAGMQVLDDFSEGVIFHGTGEDDELEGQEVAEAPDCTLEGVNPFGWIRTEAWNMLFLDQDGGCGGGGPGRMIGNWVAPYEMEEENPRPGDEWDIEFFDAESRGWTGTFSPLPTWFSAAFLQDEGGIDIAVGELVDFNVIAPQVGFNGTDNIVAIATTYVENTTDAPLRVEVCTASDDSVRIDVNNVNVTLVSACRGSAGNCQETRCAELVPGVNKITAYVWEGGGGWNMRIGLRDQNGLILTDTSEDVVFLGTGADDELEGQFIDEPPEDCFQAGPPPPPEDGGFENVGPNGIATQSSEGWGGNPQRGIDGNTDGQWGAASVTHTNGAPSWWEVDLMDTYYISYMRIWNRLDCCSERLTNFTITVLDFEREVVWEETFLPNNELMGGAFLPIEDVEAEGQYVRVSMPGQYLSIAELEILQPTDAPPPVPDEICDNGIDDDEDGDADCEDADCSEAESCQGPPEPVFVRGDADDNGIINLTDAIFNLNYLFIGGTEPTCQDSADADNNGSLQLTDGVFILMFLFNGGTPPPDPGAECGVDPADPADAIACDSYNSCN